MIEVGEYIRTNKGDIFEFQRIMESYNGDFYMWGTDYKGCYEKDVKLHSKNIIELVEVGDIVKIKNLTGDFIVSTCYHVFDITSKNILIENINNKEIELISILTHEQYEQNCYKVGDIE